jgi:hypothetical protein
MLEPLTVLLTAVLALMLMAVPFIVRGNSPSR